jgi:hypothetical protein
MTQNREGMLIRVPLDFETKVKEIMRDSGADSMQQEKAVARIQALLIATDSGDGPIPNFQASSKIPTPSGAETAQQNVEAQVPHHEGSEVKNPLQEDRRSELSKHSTGTGPTDTEQMRGDMSKSLKMEQSTVAEVRAKLAQTQARGGGDGDNYVWGTRVKSGSRQELEADLNTMAESDAIVWGN